MFEFQMNIKDAIDVSPERMEEFGIVRSKDRRFSSNPKFVVKEFSPKNLDDALEYIFQVFYFLPLFVWIDGKKINPSEESNRYVKNYNLRDFKKKK